MEKLISGTEIADFVVYDKDEPILVSSLEGESLFLIEQYCGDYSLWFIVRINSNNKELNRNNLKYVAEYTLK